MVDACLQVGGIIINRKVGGDFFQPLCFESRSKDAPPVDLFEAAFGKRPDLQPIVGSKSVAFQVYGPDTLASLSKTLRSSVPAL